MLATGPHSPRPFLLPLLLSVLLPFLPSVDGDALATPETQTQLTRGDSTETGQRQLGGNTVCTESMYRGDTNSHPPPKIDVMSKNGVKRVVNNPNKEGTAGRGLFTTYLLTTFVLLDRGIPLYGEAKKK